MLDAPLRGFCLLVGRLLTRFALVGRPEEEVGLDFSDMVLLLEGLLVEEEEEDVEAARLNVVSAGAVSALGFEKLKLYSSEAVAVFT